MERLVDIDLVVRVDVLVGEEVLLEQGIVLHVAELELLPLHQEDGAGIGVGQGPGFVQEAVQQRVEVPDVVELLLLFQDRVQDGRIVSAPAHASLLSTVLLAV